MIDKAKAVTKEDIRRMMARRRKEMGQQEIDEKSVRIAEFLLSLDFIKNSQTIMAYVNMPGEVRTEKIIEDLLKAGKTVVVPVCITQTVDLLASQIKGLDELVAGHYGILEPKKEYIRPVDPSILEVIIVPGLAFDIHGNRIGHGKGYYDRFLMKVPPFAKKVGLAFDFQVMPSVPVCHFDVPMDLIITESGIKKVM
ncbi:MAG: 5-formyltetrahydrofolate cyclo-ligase [Caldicoprobacter oshimai]|uniref:5-formyltetrahydrofolate cyclo-ligase n=1 Tax=Caldicoprobacter faecalis TaxID=937334 RepID=A0A1I5RXJ7_9FIRM|nr:5-formyltetrahydrofolate cyclo-ligase [Caldicoprobacter faecalis]PZN10688.1 MAG: 5-formyltetrahydrofolate cyclo-ligase [Caldicoprobacter oshimai]SFP63249.1 5-formyltetrahydrofolate cyclo-ligase [Caldicoprobacter faecalis]